MALQPMMANPLEIDQPKHANQWARVVSNEYYMEPKLDGWRGLLDFTGTQPAVWTRSGRDISDRLAGWLTTFDWEEYKGLVLDSELGYAESWCVINFNMTARMLGSGVDIALAKWETHMERKLNLTAFVFDIPTYASKMQWQRNRELSKIIGNRDPHQPICRVAEIGTGWNREHYIETVNKGAEGVMLKNPTSFYHYESRPTQTWYKVKKFETVDAVIVGYEPGQGKYSGQIGNIIFQLEDGRVGKCSGMSDDERQDISDHQTEYLARWIEIRYFGGVGKDKAGIRHPQFVRFRDDK